MDPPHPRGFRGLSIVKNLSPRRTVPKFGTDVRIDTLTLKKIDPPQPRGVSGLNCLARLALARERTPSNIINKTTIKFKFCSAVSLIACILLYQCQAYS